MYYVISMALRNKSGFQMSENHVPSVFQSFNARTLEPEQVARTFIPPKQFWDITTRSHTLIVGPRGSGKTTLLKMLQPQALESWTHKEAEKYVSNIDYTGVFIPADISWGAQLNALGGENLSPNIREKIGVAAFSTHIFMSLVDAMLARSANPGNAVRRHYAVDMSSTIEAEIARELADGWELKLRLPSLKSVRLALVNRLLSIGKLGSELADATLDEKGTILARHSYIHLDAVIGVVLGIEVFNSHIGERGHRWALLFDELEIAPVSIRKSLLGALRSIDQRIILKLSISPYSEDVRTLEQGLSAVPGQDYLPVPLWYSTKDSAYQFCDALLRSMMQEYGCTFERPEDIFGASEFATSRSDWEGAKTAYRPNSQVSNRFLSLANKDSTFSRYLERHKIDPKKLHLLPKEKRERHVRKVRSIVSVREAFRTADVDAGSTGNYRSRKHPKLFAGATSLFAITEGNPRWFIGMIGPLLRQYVERGERVPASDQIAQIEKATHRFRALLKTIPCSPIGSFSDQRGLLSILDKLGEFFGDEIIRKNFKPEPIGTFTIDSSVEPSLLEALGKALNAGALVYVPDEHAQDTLTELRGKRFRLSYLLAPHYKLPLTVGRARSLYKILSEQNTELMDLFAESEITSG